MRFTTLIIGLTALLAAGCQNTQDGNSSGMETESESIYLTPEIMCGTVTLTDGCGVHVDTLIRFGLALIHHMTYEDAEHSFDRVIAKDPDCFWGHWGKAMSYVHPLWSDPPSAEKFVVGKTHAQRALSLATNDKEKSYAAAIVAYYSNVDRPEAERLTDFHAGWKTVHEAFPEDIEATLFYGLTKLAIVTPMDKSYATQLEVGGLAEKVLETVPDHPGAFHYAIHAYDIPALANKALYVANNYGKIAPEIPHALHMPSHIFTRLGYWQESIDWNTRSAKAAMGYNAQGNRSMHYFHAIDYIVYASLQQGDDALADRIRLTADTLSGPYQVTVATAYALAAIPARVALERHNWEEAAKLTPPHPDLVDWNKFPAFETITHFAKGIGAARSGQEKVAMDALARIDSLISTLEQNKAPVYWASQAKIQRAAVNAWNVYTQGDRKSGLALMNEAATLEAATEKHPVSPGEIIPIAELYGDMLLESGMPAEAHLQYVSALERTPNRYNGLYGAARSAELSNDPTTAKKYYDLLITVAKSESSGRTSLTHARESLKVL